MTTICQTCKQTVPLNNHGFLTRHGNPICRGSYRHWQYNDTQKANPNGSTTRQSHTPNR